ncbi:MAG: tRNA (cytidine(34)-2'-O)-methyltransferase [Robiginitomaculum sp.]|nr:tRNA (cytidine(34)-2'-O)-methyltransferase [Robiginitomaculum sp.]
MKIVLYQPDIAQNLGAAMRLCACFDVSLAVIEPCGFPLTNKALRRTAMDYAANIELIRYKNWEEFVDSQAKQGGRTPRALPRGRIVLLSTKASTDITDFEFRANDILLFGQESAGVPEEVHQASHERIYIPISKNTRSLNLVSSASIALFEALRQTA